MKTIKMMILLTAAVTLVGCGSDGGAGGSASVNGVFNDTAVDSFNYTTGGVALRTLKKGSKNIINFALPTAMAAVNKSYSCISGEQVKFEMDALGKDVDVTTTCSSSTQIETDIRAGLLTALDNNRLRATKSEAEYSYYDSNDGVTPRANYGTLDFTANAFGFYPGDITNDGILSSAHSDANLYSKIFVVKEKHNCDGGMHKYTVFIFKDDGKVYNYTLLKGDLATSLNVDVDIADQATSAGPCYNGEITDSNGDGLVDKTLSQAELRFRFKDGALEFDFSGQGVFAESHGEDNGSTCNNATIPSSNSCESSFEKWEVY